MQYLGIDPGKQGSISVISVNNLTHATKSTLESCKLSETEQDIWCWLNDSVDMLSAVATIEKVASSPQMGVVSAFTFGRGYGFLVGMLTAIQIPFKYITPQQWQKGMKCLTKGDKNVSKAAAQRLWPKIKITHNNADSLLIAEYGRQYLWQ
jgi:crossover junction endodeoxyribonuclease RuvC